MAESIIRKPPRIKMDQIAGGQISEDNPSIAFTGISDYAFLILEFMYAGIRTTINASTLDSYKYIELGNGNTSSVVLYITNANGFTFSNFNLNSTNQYFYFRVFGVYSG